MQMNTKFQYMYDAAPASALISKGAAKTASFVGNTITLDTLKGFWTSGELADKTLAIVVNVDAADFGTGDETYDLEAKVGAVTVGVTPVTGPGQYVILLDMMTVAKTAPGETALTLAGTVAGTTPSITLYSWISGIQK